MAAHRIDVLGASGGLGAENGSTCIRLGESILVDAGTGLSRLNVKQMRKIKHVVLTHSHMDHIASLPMFLSNMFEGVEHQVQVYALRHTIEKLKTHIFNDEIWPDFTRSMGPVGPVVVLNEVDPGDRLKLEGLEINLFPVEHTVPTVGVSVRGDLLADDTVISHFAFTSDTTEGSFLNDQLHRLGAIDVLMIECSFPDDKYELARQTKHMTPEMVFDTLEALEVPPQHVWISHLKPSFETELREALQEFHVL
ncbi:3',5'-cyclic-nucleotide phosphodiesterase [Aliidiomarina sanyensis]|uniref:3',5'-cyclic-nucleotide phosphodiesterase n=1 Tax=Aliidiomarina sanyensis TaxID=1249555 RepID=A0A432WGD7_9GAMM|nr:3',5'-cyclic-nucleotide phosphodiesterase [Aliidiomarina sanyensis]RUO32872.1 3',5'-cyclic-nucleotide phosphodiesterase [Aliidiomarina sanyensis]